MLRHVISAAVACALSTTASAAVMSVDSLNRSVSGSANGVAWQARSLMVGQTSTLTIPSGGDPIYLPTRPQKDGLGFLEITGAGYCSGSLMADGRHIVTAAHCLADPSGNPVATGGFAYFYNGPEDPLYDLDFGSTPGIERVAIDAYFLAPGYTGDVIDHNDVAIIRLSGSAPDFATRYLLGDTSDLTGEELNVAGFGNRGSSGATGASPGSFGRLREGDNRFEYRFGDPDFGTGWASILGEPFDQISHSWVSDFDRVGFAANDTSCITVGAFFGLGGPKFCDTGIGPREVGVAGGDSGGPQFLNGRIVSVTSYGLTFGAGFGDFGGGLNSGWGEFSGYAPLYLQRGWIESLVPGAFGNGTPVPEPSTWALTVIGLGLAGAAARRRKLASI